MVSEEAWTTGGHVAVTLIFKIREASLLEIHVTSVEGKRYFESIPTLWSNHRNSWQGDRCQNDSKKHTPNVPGEGYRHRKNSKVAEMCQGKNTDARVAGTTTAIATTWPTSDSQC